MAKIKWPWSAAKTSGGSAPAREIVVGSTDNHKDQLTFDNRNITYNGTAASQNFESILRDKQANITTLYQLADYYVDKDPIVRGIVKGVYTPFAMSDWMLFGANDTVRKKYEDYYKRIHLRDLMNSVFYQLFKYANVFVYVFEDGNILTLPVNQCRISNIMINGEPVVEFDAGSVRNAMNRTGTGSVERGFIDDASIDELLKGYPKEVAEGIKNNKQWVQLNPDNAFVLQETKEDWMRYAVPLITTCLTALAAKEKIQAYEGSLLDLGIRAFLHVKYGDSSKGSEYLPNKAQLTSVNNLFRAAMSGSALATTNDLATAEFVQPDMNDLFQFDKYTEVNAEILAGGGISGIIVSGRADDGSTFASAQVSMQTAALRIKQARDNFCEMMNKINMRLNASVLSRSSTEKIPKFVLPPVDLSGDKRFQEACLALWKAGAISRKTMLTVHGYDLEQEEDRRKSEEARGIINPVVEVKVQNETSSGGNGNGEMGRPTLDDSERTSDISKAKSGAQPKPSNPEGSL